MNRRQKKKFQKKRRCKTYAKYRKISYYTPKQLLLSAKHML